MREAEDFDVQPSEETDLLMDEAWLCFAATCDAQTDRDRGLTFGQGLQRLKDRDASMAEIEAYTSSWNAEALRSIARDSGIEFPNPFIFNPFN